MNTFENHLECIWLNKSISHFSSTKKEVSKKVTSEVSFGGGCINDVVIHLATSNMGFGGVGESGMGSYHGKRGFDTFSHTKSIVDKKRRLNRYIGDMLIYSTLMMSI